MKPWELLGLSLTAAVLTGGLAAYGLIQEVTGIFIAATVVSGLATLGVLVAVIALGVQMGNDASRR